MAVKRYFYSEEHPIIVELQRMKDHRAKADIEANLLAKSIGADKAFWKGTSLVGFSFADGAVIPNGWKQIGTPGGVPVYQPQRNVGTAKKVSTEMRKLTIPVYEQVLAQIPELGNSFIFEGNEVNRPGITFSCTPEGQVKRVMIVVPYYAPDAPEVLQPGAAVPKEAIVDQAPVPEGFIEWKHWEFLKFIDDLNKERLQ